MNNELFNNINGIDYYVSKVYLSYVEPELFSVYNFLGHQYLVMLVDEDERKWMMIDASFPRLRDVEYGVISVKEAFLHPEIDEVTIISKNGINVVSQKIKCADIPDSYLPLDYVKLNWKNESIPQGYGDLQSFASKRRRDALSIRVISKDTEYHTFHAGKMGDMLSCMNLLFYHATKVYNLRNGKKKNLFQHGNLNFVEGFLGSFGMRLEGECDTDFMGNSSVTPVFDVLFSILDSTNGLSTQKLVDETTSELIKSYRKLLKLATSESYELEFMSATPNKVCGRTFWNYDYSRKRLLELDKLIENETKTDQYYGRLYLANKKNFNFGFETEDGKRIEGKIDESLRNYQFKVESMNTIKVETTMNLKGTGEIKESYRLIEINPDEN